MVTVRYYKYFLRLSQSVANFEVGTLFCGVFESVELTFYNVVLITLPSVKQTLTVHSSYLKTEKNSDKVVLGSCLLA